MTIPRISLSKLHFPITALGPGRRIGIWFQGCSIRCAGCMSRDTWAFARDGEPVETVLKRMEPWFAEADGVTISGGEPFDQTDGLLALLAGLRTRFKGDVLVYSGYEFEALQARHAAALGLIDVLISEPFDEAQPTDAPLRGSANQRLHLLTALGEERFAGLDTATRIGAHRSIWWRTRTDRSGSQAFRAEAISTGWRICSQLKASRSQHRPAAWEARPDGICPELPKRP